MSLTRESVVRSPAARGVLWIHSTPSALCPHIEWALGGVLGVPTHLDWTPQPAQPGTRRAELVWHGPIGSATAITSALQKWERLRFEVTEHGTGEGMRYSVTPTLGAFHAIIGSHGDILVHEERLRAAVVAEALGRGSLADQLDQLLGKAWDEELEPFRNAGEDTPVRWLSRSLA